MGELKTSLIHRHQHSSDEYKVLGDFDAKYAKCNPTKDHGYDPVPRNFLKRHQENNAIINNVVDEILLNETQKVGAAMEAPEFLDSDYDENNLYQVEMMSLEETKEKLEWRKHAFECEQKNSFGIENKNNMTRIHDKEVNKIS